MDLPNDLLHCQAEDCQFTRKYKKRCEMCNNYKTVCFLYKFFDQNSFLF